MSTATQLLEEAKNALLIGDTIFYPETKLILAKIEAYLAKAETMSDEQEQDAFERKFPMPQNCIRIIGGYAATEHNAWKAHNHCDRWEGWKARAAEAYLAKQQAPTDELVAFLNGQATLDGVWFGEKHPTEKGLYWWRKRLPSTLAKQQVEPCNPHPDAPHGFSRNASHNAGRYVCECEGWIPEKQVEQEPVAMRYKDPEDKRWQYCSFKGSELLHDTLDKEPLYTSPQAREPMSDDEIDEIMIDNKNYRTFARAIEAHHGIGVKT
jgi:hypothetical protein